MRVEPAYNLADRRGSNPEVGTYSLVFWSLCGTEPNQDIEKEIKTPIGQC
jgi:hypothetical protein